MQDAQKEKVLSKEFSAKFRTKGEVYRFLDNDVDAYLPHADCVTIYFLKDIMTGKRKCKFTCGSNSRLQSSKRKTSKLFQSRSMTASASKGFSREEGRAISSSCICPKSATWTVFQGHGSLQSSVNS